MNDAKRGADALESGDALTALSAYTKALLQSPFSPEYFIQRSTAFQRLKPAKLDLALRDAELGVLAGQKRAKRESIQAAQHRRVVSLFGLGRYYDAQFILQTMERWLHKPKPADGKDPLAGGNKETMQMDMWKAKINQRIKNLPADASTQVTVKEYPEGPLMDEKAIKAWLQKQLKSDGSYRFEGEADIVRNFKSSEVANADSSSKTAPSRQTEAVKSSLSPSVPTPATTTLPKIRHEWYQNSQSVIITIYAKGIPREKTEIEIQEDEVHVSFPHPSNPASTFSLTFDPLFAFINPNASSFVVMLNKIELTLAKVVSGQKWPNVEGTAPLKNIEDRPAATVPAEILSKPITSTKASDKPPSYPTSSKYGPKNWDKVATDLTTKTKPKPKKTKSEDGEAAPSDSDGDADPDYDSDYGGDPADNFFKKLYASSDPDTRRAMEKSMMESNGTSLSTSWADVGKRKVEPVKGKDESL